MANIAVKIYDHQKQHDGKWKFVPVPVHIDPNKTAQQIIAKTPSRLGAKTGKYKVSWYEGAAKRFEAGSYQLLTEAIRAAKFRQVQLQGKNNGVIIQDPNTKNVGRLTIDIAALAYLRTVEKEGRPGTIALAKFDLEEFQKWNAGRNGSKRTFVDQITKDDMLDYRNMIVKSGRAPRTAVNKVMRVNNFVLTSLGLKPGEGPIKQKDAEKIITKPNENDVDYYSGEELEKFFATCDHRQHLIFSTFLYSGCRREEIEFLYWDDLDLNEGELKVRPKPEFDFTVKTKQERSVTLPPVLIERLKTWKKRAATRLVFPTKNGGPLGNSLLVSCKRVWRRGGRMMRIRKLLPHGVHHAGILPHGQVDQDPLCREQCLRPLLRPTRKQRERRELFRMSGFMPCCRCHKIPPIAALQHQLNYTKRGVLCQDIPACLCKAA
jgi:integrase